MPPILEDPCCIRWQHLWLTVKLYNRSLVDFSPKLHGQGSCKSFAVHCQSQQLDRRIYIIISKLFDIMVKLILCSICIVVVRPGPRSDYPHACCC